MAAELLYAIYYLNNWKIYLHKFFSLGFIYKYSEIHNNEKYFL